MRGAVFWNELWRDVKGGNTGDGSRLCTIQ
jgi:hypothetical protein